MEAMMDMSDGLDHSSSPVKRDPAAPAAAAAEGSSSKKQVVPVKRSASASASGGGPPGIVVGRSESGRFKKKRRVTKSVMKTDAKGYMCGFSTWPKTPGSWR